MNKNIRPIYPEPRKAPAGICELIRNNHLNKFNSVVVTGFY